MYSNVFTYSMLIISDLVLGKSNTNVTNLYPLTSVVPSKAVEVYNFDFTLAWVIS